MRKRQFAPCIKAIFNRCISSLETFIPAVSRDERMYASHLTRRRRDLPSKAMPC
jgi:hypothetical protein